MKIFRKGEVDTLILIVGGLLVGMAVLVILAKIGFVSMRALNSIYENVDKIIFNFVKEKAASYGRKIVEVIK